jgi:pyroglutamyl-peptidase
MPKVLVTGFTPFDGRSVNASWIAARSLATLDSIDTLEVPVLWGAPQRLLAPVCEVECPEVIISMGEGREGWFDIETVARNRRNERGDNHGNLPDGEPIYPDGPDQCHATIDAVQLQRQLNLAGVPARISRDAGAFLCEELLYTLETLKTQSGQLNKVVFVHLPPFGTQLVYAGERTTCDDALLGGFASILREAVLSL